MKSGISNPAVFEWKKFMKQRRWWWKPWTWFRRGPRRVVPISTYTTRLRLRPTTQEMQEWGESKLKEVRKIMMQREDAIFFRGQDNWGSSTFPEIHKPRGTSVS